MGKRLSMVLLILIVAAMAALILDQMEFVDLFGASGRDAGSVAPGGEAVEGGGAVHRSVTPPQGVPEESAPADVPVEQEAAQAEAPAEVAAPAPAESAVPAPEAAAEEPPVVVSPGGIVERDLMSGEVATTPPAAAETAPEAAAGQTPPPAAPQAALETPPLAEVAAAEEPGAEAAAAPAPVAEESAAEESAAQEPAAASEPVTAQAPPPTEEPPAEELPAEAPPAEDASGRNQVTALAVTAGGQGAILTIRTSQDVESVRHFTMDEPGRFVVDLYGSFAMPRNPGVPDNPLVQRLRLGQHDIMLRIVADLKVETPVNVTLDQTSPSTFVFTLTPPTI